ncbi:prepilin peptidase [Vibrio furnissii]|uniref:A24 family peptidase n=1 Tax=Vibrio TaxID=662 RepID=UPI001BD63CB5|nr:prepilin peptidase [Vibrio alginolyticus]EKO3434829.1 prepilin peptidase [Vibrio fluvialis]MBS9921510.1 prepilin peptidase [Vibrio alginolyticus]MBY7763950.1 prepilin peptidase [Vibrio fluvialis]MBY7772562.1 prepilin peptidase [Vibrio fluvialis]MBY7779428.1 prepilin peptidase [Vibrio fluvialis]
MLIIINILLLTFCIYSDFFKRTILNSIVLILAVTILLGWFSQPNWHIWPYTVAIVLGGLLLFQIGVLGAGDTKLLAVISLGIDPSYMPLTLVGIAMVGGVMALGYLLYGLLTDLAKVRQRGIPYGVPICLVGGLAIVVSAL